MRRPNQKESITILVDAETKAKARRLAHGSCRTLSGYVRQLLRAHIRELESLHGPIPTEEAPSARLP